MKTLLLIIITTGVTALSAFKVEDARRLYVKSVEDEKTAEKLYKSLKNTNDVLLKGYRGAAQTILAKHYINPISKWNYFSDGCEELDAAIKSVPTDPELRFLRFSIQTNAPAFLGYNGNIYEDKDVIIDNLALLKFDNNHEMRELIVDYLLETSYCTYSEKKMIKETLASK